MHLHSEFIYIQVTANNQQHCNVLLRPLTPEYTGKYEANVNPSKLQMLPSSFAFHKRLTTVYRACIYHKSIVTGDACFNHSVTIINPNFIDALLHTTCINSLLTAYGSSKWNINSADFAHNVYSTYCSGTWIAL